MEIVFIFEDFHRPWDSDSFVFTADLWSHHIMLQAADINVAEGKKQARILQSEAEKQELINAAEGAAKAVIAAGEARAKSIGVVAEGI